jgi:predicted DNA-binding transcriptional regulator AlpA
MSRLIRFNELRNFGIPWSRPHLSRLEKEGRFPKRITMSKRTMGWAETDIEAFVRAVIRESSQQSGSKAA